MPTATNASAAKGALIAVVTMILAADPDTNGVMVTYGYSGREAERELVHAGRAYGQQEYATAAGRPRFSRDEKLIVKLHVVVHRPGDLQAEAEARCVEIGTVIEERLASTDPLPGVTGLISAGVVAVDLDGDTDDDGAIGVLTYDVEVNSRLT